MAATDPTAIITPRLRLVPLPPDARPDDVFLQVPLRRMEEDPGGRGWCVRAMVRVEDSAVVGHCGFHGPPMAVGRAEIGYIELVFELSF